MLVPVLAADGVDDGEAELALRQIFAVALVFRVLSKEEVLSIDLCKLD